MLVWERYWSHQICLGPSRQSTPLDTGPDDSVGRAVIGFFLYANLADVKTGVGALLELPIGVSLRSPRAEREPMAGLTCAGSDLVTTTTMRPRKLVRCRIKTASLV